MHLKYVIGSVFADLEAVLLILSDEEYAAKSARLFGATIGQHVRHIIELFQCLEAGYDSRVVNYDKRKRDTRIETDRLFAVALMTNIADGVSKEDRELVMAAGFGSDDEQTLIATNYYRELVYNLEHTIHHMALVRVGIQELTSIGVPANFGVAPSTIQYRKTCAQ